MVYNYYLKYGELILMNKSYCHMCGTELTEADGLELTFSYSLCHLCAKVIIKETNLCHK